MFPWNSNTKRIAKTWIVPSRRGRFLNCSLIDFRTTSNRKIVSYKRYVKLVIVENNSNKNYTPVRIVDLVPITIWYCWKCLVILPAIFCRWLVNLIIPRVKSYTITTLINEFWTIITILLKSVQLIRISWWLFRRSTVLLISRKIPFIYYYGGRRQILISFHVHERTSVSSFSTKNTWYPIWK